MEHNLYWSKVTEAASGIDNEPADQQLLDKLVGECGEYVESLKATEEHVYQAFEAIYNLQDRSVVTQFLKSVEDPKIIRIIFEIDETECANIDDEVRVMLAGNPHTPKDVLQRLAETDFVEDHEVEQIQGALRNNPSAKFLFSEVSIT